VSRPHKKYHEYLEDDADSSVASLDEYAKSPATVFLKYVVDAKDAVTKCSIKFNGKQGGSYNKDSLNSLRLLTAATLPAVMGHFETYQKLLFAGTFEATRFTKDFDMDRFHNELKKMGEIEIKVNRIGAYRGQPAPMGQIIADSLGGWHNPEKVNSHMKLLVKNVNFFSGKEMEELRVLWQLRHSIVHTGGWLTLPDAQKVGDLKSYGNKPVIFDSNVIVVAVHKKMHSLVKDATHRLENGFKSLLQGNLSPEAEEEIRLLFQVDSPNPKLLQRKPSAKTVKK
jgi:hypothetical protein